MIRIDNLCVSYKNNKVISNLSLSIESNTLTIIKGENGSGKSTLCYALSGIIPRYMEDTSITGDIIIDQQNINDYSQAQLTSKIGIVIQNPDNMIFLPTIEDEIAFAAENLNLLSQEIRQRVDKAIDLLALGELRQKSPLNLSGGEKQRVAIASVLTLDSDIIIFDEVLSCLDKENREIVLNLLDKMLLEGKSIIMVEHNAYLDNRADNIIKLERISKC